MSTAVKYNKYIVIRYTNWVLNNKLHIINYKQTYTIKTITDFVPVRSGSHIPTKFNRTVYFNWACLRKLALALTKTLHYASRTVSPPPEEATTRTSSELYHISGVRTSVIRPLKKWCAKDFLISIFFLDFVVLVRAVIQLPCRLVIFTLGCCV